MSPTDQDVWEIREVSFSDIAPLKHAAAVDRVTLRDLKNTRWFAAVRNGLIVGSAGLTSLKSRTRIRGVWVAKAYRGQGIGSAFTSRLIAECRGKITIVDALAYNPDHYVTRGFRVAGREKSDGTTRVILAR